MKRTFMNRFVDFSGRVWGGEMFQMSQKSWVRYGIPALFVIGLLFKIKWTIPIVFLAAAIVWVVDWNDYNRKYGDA